MNLVERATLLRAERTMERPRGSTGVGGRLEGFSALPLIVTPHGQIAGEQVHLFPMIVHEGCGRVRSGLKAQQPRATSHLVALVEVARQDFLLDGGRIALHRLPAGTHVQAMKFEVWFV